MREARKPAGWRAWLLVAGALCLFSMIVLLPMGVVVASAFRDGVGPLLERFRHPHTVHAMRLTAAVVAWVIPLNLLFGLSAAWLVTQYRFVGRRWIIALMDLPLTVSTIVAGLMIVTLFGPRGWLADWLLSHNIQVLHAMPSLVLVTVFVTAPIIAREITPILEQRGTEQERAALTLGAGRFATWWRITLPTLRSSLLAGVILCVARAAGEYGGIAVVSGNVRGRTQTMSLRVDGLYNDYDVVGAFGVALLLSSVALVSLSVSSAARLSRAARSRGRMLDMSRNEGSQR